MKIDEERDIFENITSGHKQMFIVAQPKYAGWALFLKFEGNKVVVCSNHSTGWCYEVPGSPIETLEHISVIRLDEEEVELQFGGQTKVVKFESEDAGLYHGR